MIVPCDLEYEKRRWSRILTRGYIGQQSFVTAHQVYHVLKRNELKIQTLLDAGCGNGAISCYLVKRFPNIFITGFDANQSNISMAQCRAVKQGVRRNINFEVSKFESFRIFSNNLWQSIISLDALQYSEDIYKDIESLLSCWNHQGTFFATLWGFEKQAKNISSMWGFHYPWSFYKVREIINILAPNDLKTILKRKHFKKRLFASFIGLQDNQLFFQDRWGKKAFNKRYKLELATVKAANDGFIYQIQIKSRENQHDKQSQLAKN